MMHDKQIRLGGDGQFHGSQAGIHGGGDFGDAAGIFHLQPVNRAGVVANGGSAENPITMSHDFLERNFWHDAMKANRRQAAKREI